MRRRIPLERYERLIAMARRYLREDPQLAHRYAHLARRIALRNRLRPPPRLKHAVCKRCGAPLVPGVNARVRLRRRREPHLAVTCLECGYVRRHPYGGGGP